MNAWMIAWMIEWNEWNERMNECIYDMSQRNTTTMMSFANNVCMVRVCISHEQQMKVTCYNTRCMYKTWRCNPAKRKGKHLAQTISWGNTIHQRFDPIKVIIQPQIMKTLTTNTLTTTTNTNMKMTIMTTSTTMTRQRRWCFSRTQGLLQSWNPAMRIETDDNPSCGSVAAIIVLPGDPGQRLSLGE